MLRFAVLLGLALCITAQYDYNNYQTTPKSNYVPITGFLHNQGLDGNYNFAYQTQDGQTRAESTGPDGGVQGTYTYTSPEGQKVQVSYKADKHGFQANSDAIPRDGNSPSYQQPSSYQQQSYQQPSYQPQSYQQPSYQPQSYQQPSYQPQSYQPPAPQSYRQSYDYQEEKYDPRVAFEHAPSNNYAIGDPSVIANLQKYFG